MKPRTSNVPCPPSLPSIELREGLPLAQVKELLAQAVHLRAVGLRVLAYYLADMDRRGLHQEAGHPTAVHYAEVRLDLSKRRARELIAVGRALFDLPALDQAFLDGRISWSKVVLLAPIVVPKHEAEWIKKAEGSTCRALKLEARLARPGGPPRDRRDRKGLPETRFELHARIGALTHRKLELAREKLSAERGVPIDQAELFDILAELVLSTDDDGSTPGRERIDGSLYRIVLHEGSSEGGVSLQTKDGPLPMGSEADCLLCDGECSTADGAPHPANDRTTSPALRRQVLARDGHCCRHCGSKRGLMAHHIHFRSRGGRTKASNLITLCSRCHRLVHDGWLVLLGEHAESIAFRENVDGVPDGHAAGEHAPGEHAAGGRPPPGRSPAGAARQVALHRPPAPGDDATPNEEAAQAAPPAPVPFDQAFREIVGQEERLARLRRAMEGAASRGDPLPHVLFTGPAGTGKTTFARALASTSGATLVKACGTEVRDAASVDALLARLPASGGVLFLDEIHTVPSGVLEHLYGAMTESRVTLLAATTDLADLKVALRSRFELVEAFDFHDEATLAAIATRHAATHGIALTARAARGVATCARGTPREALRLTRRVVDYAVTEPAMTEAAVTEPGRDDPTVVRAADVRRALAEHGFDDDGLGPLERRYLETLRQSTHPIALERLGILLGVGARTLRTCVEPFLAHRGLVEITRRGRVAS